MKINNGFNILPWYDSLEKQNCKKWYAYGQAWPLLCPQGFILPFQFISDTAISISSNIYAISVETGQAIDLGVKPTVTEVHRADITYYIVKLVSTSIVSLPIGRYNLRMNTSEGFLYSEELVVINNVNECIKVEYWNEDTLKFTSGEINFTDNFHFIFYINSTIGKPEYEFEEELTKRLGYKFIESQTSNKVYKFSFVAPEYICDAMRLIRMCDYIKLTTKFDSYNALSFAYEPKWQEQGDLAAVDVEFDTDCIIQKLESFNRRAKESFYNALLADIDEPVLFSADTVAQYYTEYTASGTISGKLIRQLTAISEGELVSSLSSIVLPVDNQNDNSQVAKKAFLSDIINKLIPKVNLSDYLLKSVWDKVFEIRTDKQGKQYIFGKLPVVTQYGITMYANGGDIDLPSLYAGLPIDGKTLIRDEKGVLMVNPDIELGGEGVSNFWDLSGIPSWITNSKPKYAYSEIEGKPDLSVYAKSSDVTAISNKLNDFLEGTDTDNIINKWKELESFLSGLSESDNLATILLTKADKNYIDENFVTLATPQSISGEKNFTGGLKVNGSPIVYNAAKKYWKLEGDLLVTGGVMMYGNNTPFTPSTIMDAILYDNSTLGINANGELYVKGSVGGASTMGSLSNVGTWADSVADVDRIMYQAAGSSSWIAKPLSSIAASGDYLPLSGGTLSNSYEPLIIKRLSNEGASFIRYQNNEGLIGTIGVGGSDSTFPYDVFFQHKSGSAYKIWHSGNDGSGSGLDADLLDGKHNGELTANLLKPQAITTAGYYMALCNSFLKKGDTVDRSWVSPTGGYTNGGFQGAWMTIMRISSDNSYYHDISFDLNENSPHWRQVVNGVSKGWRKFAFTDSNIASATKLQTARTIWGQPFDGTGNVSGYLTMPNNTNIQWYDTKGTPKNLVFLSQGNNFHVGYDAAISKYNTFFDGYNVYFRYGTTPTVGMMLESTGNVGIGTTSPSYKLDVVGTLNATTIYQNGQTLANTYLPLTGGTLQDGNKRDLLTLNTTDNSGPLLKLSVSNTSRALLGVAPSTDYGAFWAYVDGNIALLLGYDGKPYFSTDVDYFRTKYELLHSNNFSSYALPLSGGTISSSDYGSLTIFRNSMGYSAIAYSNSSDGILGYIGIGGSGSTFQKQPTLVNNDGTFVIWHSGNDGSGSSLDADLLDGKQPSELNVGSATKLQTARTIWGQPFDGTGNVSGYLTMPNNTNIQWYDTKGTPKNLVFLSQGNNFHVGYDAAISKYNTFFDGYNVYFRYGTTPTVGMMLESTGNVGIGTTSPSYKLDVNGVARAQFLYFYNTNFNDNVGYIGRAGNISNQMHLTALSGNSLGIGAGGKDNVIYINPSGNVGIGTTNPIDKLHVAGSLRLKTDSNYGCSLYFGDGEYCYLREAADDQLTIHAGKLIIDNNTIINGNLVVRGGITMYGTDGSATDFLLDVTSWSSINSTSVNQVYTARATKLLKDQVSALTTECNKITAIKNALRGISSSSSTSQIGAALNTVYNSI